ncbi:hypothetical protein GCM10027299_03120 [Larkinella ripae]
METAFPTSDVTNLKKSAIVAENKRIDTVFKKNGLRLIKCPISQYRLAKKGGFASSPLTTALFTCASDGSEIRR